MAIGIKPAANGNKLSHESEPSYPLEVLAEIIPMAGFSELSEIGNIVRKDKAVYNSENFSRALLLISERLVGFRQAALLGNTKMALQSI